MFRVFGRLLLLHNGTPLRNLIVAAYDFDQAASRPPSRSDLARAQRLGSSPTDPRGEFSIEFTEREFATAHSEPRADIVVAVFAPDIAGRAPSSDPLYLSADTRLPLSSPAAAGTDEPGTLGETAGALADRIERRSASDAACVPCSRRSCAGIVRNAAAHARC
jgi:hypothetical protein